MDMQLAARQCMLGRVIPHHFVGARIPNHDCASAIVSFRDGAFEMFVYKGMVLDLNSQAPIPASSWEALWHSPRLKNTFHFEPEIVMEMRCGVLLDNKR